MRIYLDYNATTPLDERVLEKMTPYFLNQYANPNSAHLFGMTISEALENATESVAKYLNSESHQITFTSGATESLNTIIKSFSGKKILSVETEHSAVLDSLSFLEEKNQTKVKLLKVNVLGNIDFQDLEENLKSDVDLLVIMLANNETGHIHNIKEIAKIAHKSQVKVLCDATQAIGKMNVDVKDLDIDYLVLSAHKFYGPKGVGAIYSKKADFTPLIHGGGQQRNLRSGTVNVPAIIGLAEALELTKLDNLQKIEKLRNALENELLTIEDTFRNSSEVRLINTTNICFKGVDSAQLIIALRNISVSNGAACSSVTTKPSHVLKAMGLSNADALSSIRFSVGRFSTENEIEIASAKVKQLVKYLRN